MCYYVRKQMLLYIKNRGGSNTVNNEKDRFFIVHAKVLPEVFHKTLVVKELLQKGDVDTIQDAVEIVGMSRSAYYKYKDFVFPFNEMSRGKIITMSLQLQHTTGVLSMILKEIAEVKGSILTMNQSIPLHGIANVTITFDTKEMVIDLEELILQLKLIEGVIEVGVVAKE